MRFYFMVIALAMVACTQQATQEPKSGELSPQEAQIVPIREHSVMTVLWQQKASEYKAQCYQSFNIAKIYLDQLIAQNEDSEKPLAIVTDIDETIIDNSPYNAMMIEKDIDYSKETWIEWGLQESAKAVPGALEFFNYAQTQNVEVFYISNRYTVQQSETMANVKALGYPNVDEAHFLLKETTSKKQARRDIVEESHNVVMYLGDNLSDFAEEFDGLDRGNFVDSLQSKFGFEFVLLPNPMYGDWETKEIYSGKYDWSPAQKDSIRRSLLKAY